ncbi:tumor necrosis factor-like [Acipenser ruthenus]|uniref:tumor necrosis factor-like n=1 Tax=Acipenser ruthenus TaxID=7906 RepID=UPI00155F8F28|nr:tumor necrosis factor-like [Acipenser ruthenus]
MDSQKTTLDVENGSKVLLRDTQHRTRVNMMCAVSLLGLALVGTLLFAGLHNRGSSTGADSQNDELLRVKDELEENAFKVRTLKQLASKPSKAAAHLIADVTDDKKAVTWLNDVDQAFANGIENTEDKIVVPRSGLYFVYSQVSFKGQCKNGQPVYLSHNIERLAMSYTEKRNLLSASKTACVETHGSSKDIWYKSIYQGAVFKLEKGDTLSTKTGGVDKLVVDGGNSFFGVFEL